MSEEFSLNLDFDVTSGQVSEGLHNAEVIDVELKDNKAKDGKNLVIKFKILTPGEVGRQLTMYQSLKPTVAWRYTAVLAALGVDTSSGKGKISRAALVGKHCRLSVKHEDYQGEPRAQVDNVLPADASQKEVSKTAPAAQKAAPAKLTAPKAQRTGGLDIDQGLDDFPREDEKDLPF